MPAFEMDFNWGSMSPPFGGKADWLLQVNSAASGPLPSRLRQVPEQVACKRCPQQGSAVTAEIDDLVQMFDLQAVVERVTKPVRPVEQRKRAQHEQIDSRSRMSDQCHDALVRGRLDPPQRKRQSPEEKMHRDQERGHHAARTEQSPEKRLEPYLRLFRGQFILPAGTRLSQRRWPPTPRSWPQQSEIRGRAFPRSGPPSRAGRGETTLSRETKRRQN